MSAESCSLERVVRGDDDRLAGSGHGQASPVVGDDHCAAARPVEAESVEEEVPGRRSFCPRPYCDRQAVELAERERLAVVRVEGGGHQCPAPEQGDRSCLQTVEDGRVQYDRHREAAGRDLVDQGAGWRGDRGDPAAADGLATGCGYGGA
jgi:hypothetical protein